MNTRALGIGLWWVLGGTLSAGAQQLQDTAVQWSFQAQQTTNGLIHLQATASLRPGWRLFSLSMPEELPNTRLGLDSGQQVTLLSVKESRQPITEKSDLLGELIRYHTSTVTLEAELQLPDAVREVKGAIVYMAYQGTTFTNPERVPFRFVRDASGTLSFRNQYQEASTAMAARVKRNPIDLAQPQASCGGTGAEGKKSLGRIFLLGILGGLLGLIMPCTFPMIPMTVSFFTKKAQGPSSGVRQAFLYGFFIFLIYVLLSVPFYFLEAGNQDILNNISTNAWLNLFFALIFFVFALSFFGLFEITLPSGFANKTDTNSRLGSWGGLFFMALTLAIVSFSCTGPILGTLLVGALTEDGGALQLTVAMAGFGLALGLPFGLFALFPQWLNTLPRSGSWMHSVKIVFAFIELALMIKFLSNADLVMHWGLLKREVFVGIWILIGLATTTYLFGWLRFPGEAPLYPLSRARITLGVVFLVFTLYLLPGLTNTRWANLSVISGFPPPLSYSVYGKESVKEKGVEATVVNDYEKALRLAKETGKPLLLDFTGWACVNCRKMEENVWPQGEIRELIEKEVILVSLYVDDRAKLPDDDQFSYTLHDGSKKLIRTIGDLYTTFQSENFQNASQPLYVMLSAEEKLLNRPVGYTPDPKAYAEWLRCGLAARSK